MFVSGFTKKRLLSMLSVSMIIVMLMGQFAFAQQVLRISGASTIQPILEIILQSYEEKTGLTVELVGGGSGTGMRDATNGLSDVGMVSRALTPAEKEQAQYTTIGMDALVVIVNERNPLEEASKKEIKSLFQGDITNWKELGGQDRPVVLISMEVGRSTLELFEDYSGLQSPSHPVGTGAETISTDAFEIGSNLECITLVGGIPGAIGYVSYGTALILLDMNMPIKILKLDGMDASVTSINNGTYPIVRELNLVYQGENEAALSFIEMALSAEGQQAVENQSFIPLR